MTWSLNGVGNTNAFLWRYDSTLLSFVRWDGAGGAGPGASSTQVAVSSLAGTVTTQPQSTVWAGNAGFHFDGSGSLLTAGGAGGSSQVTISQFLDSSGGVVNPLDSVNKALKVNVVAGSAAGSTTVNVSSLAGVVNVQQNSTVWQVQINGNSTVFQGSSLWQVQVSNGNSSVTISAIAAGAGRLNIGSTAADNAVSISGNSTVAPLAGSVWTIQGNSTAFQGGAPWTFAGNSTVAPLAGSTWATRPIQSSAADLQMTATPAAGSTWTVRPIQSSRADLNVTAFNSDNLGNLIESSTNSGSATNSTRRGMGVRPLIPDCTNASAQAASSGDIAVFSSAANTIYVYAYSVSLAGAASTTVGGVPVRFLSGSTAQIWRVHLGVIGASTAAAYVIAPSELAVTPPAYLFKTAAAAALTMNATSSGVVYSVAAFRE